MANLKPRLMMTQTGRKRRGFGKLLFVLIIFAAGFYAGSKYGDSVYEFMGPQQVPNISEIEDPVNDKETLAVKQESTKEVNTKIYSNPGNQDVKDQSFLTESLLDTEGETSTHYPIQNEIIASNDSSQDALVSGEESGSSLEVGGSLDNAESADNSDEAAKTQSGYTLQVAAFSTPEEANGVAEGYIAKGYKAYVVPIDNSRGESWNLVKIGRFNTIDQAFSYSTYFKNREGVQAYVESLEQETVFNESWNNSEQAEIE